MATDLIEAVRLTQSGLVVTDDLRHLSEACALVISTQPYSVLALGAIHLQHTHLEVRTRNMYE